MIPAESESYLTPEARARREIDRQLAAAAWAVQSADEVNLAAGQGVAVPRVLTDRLEVGDHAIDDLAGPEEGQ